MQSNGTAIAKRYASALFECLDTRELQQSVLDQVELLMRLVSPEVAALLAKQSISPTFKKSIIDEISAAVKPEKLLSRTLDLLAERNRLGVLTAFLAELRRCIDGRLGIQRVEYLVATEMASAEQKSLEASLVEVLGATVRLKVTVQPDLLAGCILRVGHRVADMSLKSRVLQIRDALSQGV
jgi:F-type H+-transporting ATPase subunit delta